MKKYILSTISIILFAISFMGAQEVQPPKPSKTDESREAPLFPRTNRVNGTKHAKYKVWVYLNDSSKVEKGYLYKVTDSTILISKTYRKLDNPNLITKEFPIGRIEEIKLAKQGRLGNSMLIGSSVGLTIGAYIGGRSAREEQQDGLDSGGWLGLAGIDNIAGGMMIGTVLGFAGGAAIGSSKIIIPLQGSMELYQKYKEQLSEYALIK